MYAWRNLQSKNIVAAFLNLRAKQADQPVKKLLRKSSPLR